MKRILVVAALWTIVIAFASCGGGARFSPPTVGGGDNTGFSNSSLNGTWVFSARGSGSTNDFAVLGVFTADGNGNITSGSQDVNDSNAGYSANTPVTGSYSVGSDGRGQIQLRFSGGSVVFRFVFTSPGKARFFEVSGVEDATGQMLKQDPAAISNLSGNYVLRLDGFFNGTIDSVVGQISASGGPTNGTMTATLDENAASSVTEQQSASGTFTMGSNGKGTAAITGAAGTFNLAYYIVNSGHVEFLETDVDGVLSGGADAQGGPFSSVAFNGPFVFSIAGLADNGGVVQTVKEVGRIQLDGGGNITSSFEDFNFGGNFQENVPFTGTYTVQQNGRFTLHFVYSDGTADYVGWLSDSQNGVLFTTDANILESGTLKQQTVTATNATLNGNYGLAYAGPDYAGGFEVQLTAATKLDGAGNITGTEDHQSGGLLSANSTFTGTYSVGSGGKAIGTIEGIPMSLYIVDGSTAYFISAAPNRGYSGVLISQH